MSSLKKGSKSLMGLASLVDDIDIHVYDPTFTLGRLDVKTRLYIRYLKKYEQDITGMVTITKDPA